MRVILTIFLMLLTCSYNTYAVNSFVTESKVWHCGKWKAGFTELEDRYYYIQGDTVINGISGKKMYLKFSKESTTGTYQAALYEENHKVFCCRAKQNEYSLLYDFGVQEGEEVTISGNTYTVEKVEERIIKDTALRVIYLKHEMDNEKYQFTWVEGFGGISSPLYSGPLLPGSYESFSDCEINGEVVLERSDIPSTVQSVQHSDLTFHSHASTLTCASLDAVKLEVYTLDAVKVGEARFTNGQATVKVNRIPATYLYIVTYPDGRRESGKTRIN